MKSFQFTLLFLRVCAELGYSAVRESLEWRSHDGAAIRHSGPLNPLRGFLFSSIGALHNMRFFSPGISPCYTLTFADERPSYRRHYNRDTALHNDAFHRTLLALFPSSAGRVSIATTRCGSFCYELSKSKERRQAAVRLLAALAAMSLGTDIRWSSKTAGKRHSVTVHVSPPIVMQGSSLDEVASVVEFFATPGKDKGYLRSKMFLLQGFVHHFLDTRDELEAFFGHVYELARRSDAFTETGETERADYRLLDCVVEVDRAFPFSPVRPMPTNMSVPVYSRTTDTFGNTHFSDCGEAALLGLVCCLLYDTAEMRYSTGHLGECRLKEFFARHGEVSAVTMDIRRDWLRVVEDLSDEDVVYVKRDVRNEIEMGYLNMIAILQSVCGMNRSSALESLRGMRRPSSYDAIKAKFENVFIDVASHISLSKIRIEFNRMSVELIQNSCGWDVFGVVTFIISVTKDIQAIVELKHTPGHAESNLVLPTFMLKEEVKTTYQVKEEYETPENVLIFLVNIYFKLCTTCNTVKENLFSSMTHMLSRGRTDCLFLNGPVDTENLKTKVLDAVFPYIDREHREMTHIYHNIIVSATLNDPATLSKYAIFIMLSELRKGALGTMVARSMLYKSKESVLMYAANKRFVNIACHLINKNVRVSQEYSHIYDLISLLIRQDRIDCIKKIAEIREIRACVLTAGFQAAAKESRWWYTAYFFDKVTKDDLMKCEHSFEDNKAVQFLKTVAVDTNTDTEVLKKIYCWYFCANNVYYMDELFSIVEKTHMHLCLDFIYDCIARRCPRYYRFAKFHKMFLELVIKNNISVRNDAFALFKHVAEMLSSDSRYVVLAGRRLKLQTCDTYDHLKRDLADLVHEIEERQLVEKTAVFNEEEYIRFLEMYVREQQLRNMEPRDYINGMRNIFGA